MNVHQQVRAKLTTILGAKKADDTLTAYARTSGVQILMTPDHAYAFADYLIAMGSIHEVLGRTIKLQAILQGAQRH